MMRQEEFWFSMRETLVTGLDVLFTVEVRRIGEALKPGPCPRCHNEPCVCQKRARRWEQPPLPPPPPPPCIYCGSAPCKCELDLESVLSTSRPNYKQYCAFLKAVAKPGADLSGIDAKDAYRLFRMLVPDPEYQVANDLLQGAFDAFHIEKRYQKQMIQKRDEKLHAMQQLAFEAPETSTRSSSSSSSVPPCDGLLHATHPPPSVAPSASAAPSAPTMTDILPVQAEPLQPPLCPRLVDYIGTTIGAIFAKGCAMSPLEIANVCIQATRAGFRAFALDPDTNGPSVGGIGTGVDLRTNPRNIRRYALAAFQVEQAHYAHFLENCHVDPRALIPLFGHVSNELAEAMAPEKLIAGPLQVAWNRLKKSLRTISPFNLWQQSVDDPMLWAKYAIENHTPVLHPQPDFPISPRPSRCPTWSTLALWSLLLLMLLSVGVGLFVVWPMITAGIKLSLALSQISATTLRGVAWLISTLAQTPAFVCNAPFRMIEAGSWLWLQLHPAGAWAMATGTWALAKLDAAWMTTSGYADTLVLNASRWQQVWNSTTSVFTPNETFAKYLPSTNLSLNYTSLETNANRVVLTAQNLWSKVLSDLQSAPSMRWLAKFGRQAIESSTSVGLLHELSEIGSQTISLPRLLMDYVDLKALNALFESNPNLQDMSKMAEILQRRSAATAYWTSLGTNIVNVSRTQFASALLSTYNLSMRAVQAAKDAVNQSALLPNLTAVTGFLNGTQIAAARFVTDLLHNLTGGDTTEEHLVSAAHSIASFVDQIAGAANPDALLSVLQSNNVTVSIADRTATVSRILSKVHAALLTSTTLNSTEHMVTKAVGSAVNSTSHWALQALHAMYGKLPCWAQNPGDSVVEFLTSVKLLLIPPDTQAQLSTTPASMLRSSILRGSLCTLLLLCIYLRLRPRLVFFLNYLLLVSWRCFIRLRSAANWIRVRSPLSFEVMICWLLLTLCLSLL